MRYLWFDVGSFGVIIWTNKITAGLGGLCFRNEDEIIASGARGLWLSCSTACFKVCILVSMREIPSRDWTLKEHVFAGLL